MNYETIQMLIKSLIVNFKCSFCQSPIETKDINLLSIEWQKLVDICINCPKCKNKSFIKSKIISIELPKINSSKIEMSVIKNIKPISINDNLISDLDKNLKKDKLSVNDLFDKQWQI